MSRSERKQYRARALASLDIAQSEALDLFHQARDHSVSLQAAIEAMLLLMAKRDEEENG